MFPFLNPNTYPLPPFPFNPRFDNFRERQNDINPFLYHFVNNNFPLHHDNPMTNHYPPSQMPFFFDRKFPLDQNSLQPPRKKKRITKKIALTQLKKKIRSSNDHFKPLKGHFKYFDPSRAPPVTSLRNQQELQMDLADQKLKGSFSQMIDQKQNLSTLETEQKLSILLAQPEIANYPFLICKKRKYHRNLKRRYSVAYFQQRAVFIVNKEPIPQSLHPKNKVRKPRVPKNQGEGPSDSSEASHSSEYLSSYSSSDHFQGNEKAKVFVQRPKKSHRFEMNQIKEEIQSPSPEDEEL